MPSCPNTILHQGSIETHFQPNKSHLVRYSSRTSCGIQFCPVKLLHVSLLFLFHVLPFRVSITTSQDGKHRLPVNDSCAFSHVGNIGYGKHEAEGYARKQPCTFADGTPVNNHDDLWRCMHEADCGITDDVIQMAVWRDPRPAIVSTYYYILVHTSKRPGDLDAFFIRELPIICPVSYTHLTLPTILRV